MRVELRDARVEDIPIIAADARMGDITEMAALGTTVSAAMVDGLERSDWALTGMIDDVPVCMFGVAPRSIILGEGVPWMLSANGLERAQVKFLKACRPAVKAMTNSYPRLMNFVHADNRVTIKWLRWLGFSFAPPNWPKDEALPRYSVNGQPFLLFSIGF